MNSRPPDEGDLEYEEQLKAEANEELEKNRALIIKFITDASRQAVALEHHNFDFSRPIGVMANADELLLKLTGLTPDKEGLFLFRELLKIFKRSRFASGNLYGETFVAFSNPLFRRGFHPKQGYLSKFLDFFWGLDHEGTDTYLSLDLDRVGIELEYSYGERDSWYGATFNKEINEIPDGVGKLRPPSFLKPHHIRFFFASTYSLDVKWSTSGSIRNFYLEDFKTEEVTVERDGTIYYPARYIHAEYDTESGMFRHLDGALHFYTEDEYLLRRDSDLNYNGKNDWQIKTLSEKMFKINGKVSVDTGILLVSHFLTGNLLIFEYLEGKIPDDIQVKFDKIKKQLNS